MYNRPSKYANFLFRRTNYIPPIISCSKAFGHNQALAGQLFYRGKLKTHARFIPYMRFASSSAKSQYQQARIYLAFNRKGSIKYVSERLPFRWQCIRNSLSHLLHEVAQPALVLPASPLHSAPRLFSNGRRCIIEMSSWTAWLLRVGVVAPCAGLEVLQHFQVTATLNFHLIFIIAHFERNASKLKPRRQDFFLTGCIFLFQWV